jgi:hypothetical protein
MKKLFVILLAAFMLVGCYDKTTKISDAKTVLVTLDNKTITKGDIYDVMGKVEPYPAVVTLTLSKKMILAKEVGTTAEITAAATTALNAFLEKNKADVAKAIKDAGYKTQEDIYNNKFIVEAQADALVSKYLTDTFTTIVSTYKPVKARLMEIEKKADADLALAAIKNGQSFDAVALKYGDKKYVSDSKIYYTGSDLPELVATFLQAARVPTLSDVMEDTDNKLFYIIQVNVADANSIKDEIITTFTKDANFIELGLMGYYTSNKFTIYDRTLYDMIKTNYPDYIIK